MTRSPPATLLLTHSAARGPKERVVSLGDLVLDWGRAMHVRGAPCARSAEHRR